MKKIRAKTKVRKEDIKFFYVYKNVKQLALVAGEPSVIVQVIVDGHISQGGRLMCGESKEAVKNRAKGDTVKEVLTREGSILCVNCQENYKQKSALWTKWAESVKVTNGNHTSPQM